MYVYLDLPFLPIAVPPSLLLQVDLRRSTVRWGVGMDFGLTAAAAARASHRQRAGPPPNPFQATISVARTRLRAGCRSELGLHDVTGTANLADRQPQPAPSARQAPRTL